VWSLPFQACCACLTFSLMATTAVPVTTVSVTQVRLAPHFRTSSLSQPHVCPQFHDSSQYAWVASPKLTNMMWSITVKGCNFCLFLILPFAYFYTESSWSPDKSHRRGAWSRRATPKTQWGTVVAWWREFVGRFITSFIEVGGCSCRAGERGWPVSHLDLCCNLVGRGQVALLGTILYGLFYVIQLWMIDGGEFSWKYPSEVVSTVHILPGLFVFATFTPVRHRTLRRGVCSPLLHFFFLLVWCLGVCLTAASFAGRSAQDACPCECAPARADHATEHGGAEPGRHAVRRFVAEAQARGCEDGTSHPDDTVCQAKPPQETRVACKHGVPRSDAAAPCSSSAVVRGVHVGRPRSRTSHDRC